MAKKRKGPKTLFDKVRDIDEYFVQEIYTLTDEKLEDKLIDIAKQVTLNENERDKDSDLKSLREQLKTANETYSVPLNALKLKRKLVYKLLEERGKAP